MLKCKLKGKEMKILKEEKWVEQKREKERQKIERLTD